MSDERERIINAAWEGPLTPYRKLSPAERACAGLDLPADVPEGAVTKAIGALSRLRDSAVGDGHEADGEADCLICAALLEINDVLADLGVKLTGDGK